MRVTLLMAGLLAGVCAGSQAQTLKTVPQAGLWEQEVQVLLNGQDVMGALRLGQSAVMARLSPAQRAQLQAMLPPQEGPVGKVRQCVTAPQAAVMADPRAALARALKTQPRCSAQIVSVTGDQVTFKGRCDDPASFTGDYSGTYTLLDATRWTYAMQGRGVVSPTLAEQVPGGAALIGPVEMKASGQGRWLAQECGAVQPAP
ncbi:MAG: DUF3617 family protein [Burkholderiales bacterium]